MSNALPAPEQRTMQVFTALARWLFLCSQSSLLEEIISGFPLYHKDKLEKDLETQEEEEKADPTMPTKPHLHLHGCPPWSWSTGKLLSYHCNAERNRMCILHPAGAIPPMTAANLQVTPVKMVLSSPPRGVLFQTDLTEGQLTVWVWL